MVDKGEGNCNQQIAKELPTSKLHSLLLIDQEACMSQAITCLENNYTFLFITFVWAIGKKATYNSTILKAV